LNPYEVLDVEPDAGEDEVERAFRKKAMETHPDRGGADGAFDEVQTAYLVLLDPERRRRYDETGSTESAPNREYSDTVCVLGSEFMAVLENAVRRGDDIGKVNLVNLVRKSLLEKVDRFKEQAEALDKAAEKLKEARFRLTEKRPAIALVIDEQVAEMRKRIDVVVRDKNKHLKALEALNDCSYRTDQPSAIQAVVVRANVRNHPYFIFDNNR
jgi:hypothetical protein